jgi:hypothetical protein
MKNAICLSALLYCAVLQAQRIYLPANAVIINQVAQESPMLTLVEQFGRYPYKGADCGNTSSSFDQAPDGRQIGNLEYASINVNIQHYTEEGRSSFDNIVQYMPPAGELKKYVQEWKSQTSPDYKRTVVIKPMPDGELAIVTDRYLNCAESVHKEYTMITFSGYALQGLNIVKTSGSYYSTDAQLAEKMHNETTVQVKKTGFTNK